MYRIFLPDRLPPHRDGVASVAHFDSYPAGSTYTGLFDGIRKVPTSQYSSPRARERSSAPRALASSLLLSYLAANGDEPSPCTSLLKAIEIRKYCRGCK